jgi:hypothetical protein
MDVGAGNIMDLLDKIVARLTVLEAASASGLPRVGSIESQQMKHQVTHMEDTLFRANTGVTARLGQLERATTSASVATLTTKHQALEATVDAVYKAMYDPTGRVEQLQAQIKSLDSKLDMGGVVFEEHTFRSFSEFQNWVQPFLGGQSLDYGLFHDAFTILHGNTVGTKGMEKAVDEAQKLQKANYPSRLAARVATSYQSETPDVFGPGKDDGGFGTKMATYACWDDPKKTGGMAHNIKTMLGKDSVSITQKINMKLTGDLGQLARAMLQAAKIFVNELVTFCSVFVCRVEQVTWHDGAGLMGVVVQLAR